MAEMTSSSSIKRNSEFFSDSGEFVKFPHFVVSPLFFVGPISQNAKGLGTLFGVYIPALQSILGPVLFLRLGWIVGQQVAFMSTPLALTIAPLRVFS